MLNSDNSTSNPFFEVSFYRDMLDHLPAMIFYKDKNGTYQYCNEALLTLFEKPREEVIGKTDRQVLVIEAAAKIKAQEDLMMKTGEHTVYQLQLIDRNQKTHDLLVHASLVKAPSGEVLGIAGLMSNISDSLVACIDLTYKIAEMEKMNKLSVGRELKMIELKQTIKDLEAQIKTSYVKAGPKK